MTKATLLLAAVLVAPFAHADERVEQRAPADPTGEVTVLNVAGDIRVRGWDRAEVEVTGRLGRGVERLEFSAEGKRTVIRVELPKGDNRDGSASLEIRVPEGSSLSTNTVSADQEIENVRGLQRLQAVSGDVTTEAWSEEVEIRTVSGDVELQGHGQSALATVTTVSGDARLDDVAGEVAINTVTGDFTIDAGVLTRGRMRTTNGDLDLTTTLAADGRLDIETINGDLSIDFEGPLAAEFDIETFNGEIENCFGPEPVRTSKFAPGRELRFREGDGDARVRIKSLNGGIRFCR
ncbi:MAG TPA: DUF4097 family beta strand repeat-containing protein [Steroidobacteraceae bacterium]|nr:DUF4097 family beta strand repeat-containing protein [Steroidobacteraceae bacterium]